VTSCALRMFDLGWLLRVLPNEPRLSTRHRVLPSSILAVLFLCLLTQPAMGSMNADLGNGPAATDNTNGGGTHQSLLEASAFPSATAVTSPGVHPPLACFPIHSLPLCWQSSQEVRPAPHPFRSLPRRQLLPRAAFTVLTKTLPPSSRPLKHEFGFDATRDEKFKAVEDAVILKSHVTRRLGITNVVPGADTIQSALAAASPGDELVLGDGTYQLSSTITIDKDITIRASNSRQAILDGGDSVQVMYISSGTVVLEGVVITRGSSSTVSPHAL
jgi:hypothetical protein